MVLRQIAPSAIRCIKTSRASRHSTTGTERSESTKLTKISHVIPLARLNTNPQKAQNINDPNSDIEGSGLELRAIFLSNHPPSAKRCIKTASQYA